MAKQRIPVSESATPLIGNPFAGLDLGELPAGPETPREPAPAPTTSGEEIILRKEKAGRGGKTVIVAGGFRSSFPDSEIERLAREAKLFCGCGGAVQSREILVQGEQAAKLREFFSSEGFRVRGVS